MVEASGGAGFGEVELGGLGAGDKLAVRHLDRDLALELLVEDQVDPAESALAQQRPDAIAADVRGNSGNRLDHRAGLIVAGRDGLAVVGYRWFCGHAGSGGDIPLAGRCLTIIGPSGLGRRTRGDGVVRSGRDGLAGFRCAVHQRLNTTRAGQPRPGS